MVSITTTPLFSDNSTSQSDIEALCNQYYQNSTNFITKNYDGIPENLIINLTVWFVLLVLFTFIRYIGDYGRFGLVKNSEERYLIIHSLLLLVPFKLYVKCFC